MAPCLVYFFFFNDTATTEIYTLSLHDALPICALTPWRRSAGAGERGSWSRAAWTTSLPAAGDRKSTRLNSSHDQISYAVFCLKKKKNLCIGWIVLCSSVSTVIVRHSSGASSIS